MPVAETVGDELSAKLETPIRFRFESLYAHDLSGRAGSFAKLVAGGVAMPTALTIAGLDT